MIEIPDEIVQGFLVADLVLRQHGTQFVAHRTTALNFTVITDDRMPPDVIAGGRPNGSVFVWKIKGSYESEGDGA